MEKIKENICHVENLHSCVMSVVPDDNQRALNVSVCISVLRWSMSPQTSLAAPVYD